MKSSVLAVAMGLTLAGCVPCQNQLNQTKPETSVRPKVIENGSVESDMHRRRAPRGRAAPAEQVYDIELWRWRF